MVESERETSSVRDTVPLACSLDALGEADVVGDLEAHDGVRPSVRVELFVLEGVPRDTDATTLTETEFERSFEGESAVTDCDTVPDALECDERLNVMITDFDDVAEKDLDRPSPLALLVIDNVDERSNDLVAEDALCRVMDIPRSELLVSDGVGSWEGDAAETLGDIERDGDADEDTIIEGEAEGEVESEATPLSLPLLDVSEVTDGVKDQLCEVEYVDDEENVGVGVADSEGERSCDGDALNGNVGLELALALLLCDWAADADGGEGDSDSVPEWASCDSENDFESDDVTADDTDVETERDTSAVRLLENVELSETLPLPDTVVDIELSVVNEWEGDG